MFRKPTFIAVEYMTGNIDPIAVYKIPVSGCKTMCFVKTVAYDNNSIHVTIYEILMISIFVLFDKEPLSANLLCKDMNFLTIFALFFRGQTLRKQKGSALYSLKSPNYQRGIYKAQWTAHIWWAAYLCVYTGVWRYLTSSTGAAHFLQPIKR